MTMRDTLIILNEDEKEFATNGLGANDLGIDLSSRPEFQDGQGSFLI